MNGCGRKKTIKSLSKKFRQEVMRSVPRLRLGGETGRRQAREVVTEAL